jgi:hypothetical protein
MRNEEGARDRACVRVSASLDPVVGGRCMDIAERALMPVMGQRCIEGVHLRLHERWGVIGRNVPHAAGGDVIVAMKGWVMWMHVTLDGATMEWKDELAAVRGRGDVHARGWGDVGLGRGGGEDVRSA